MKKIKSTIVLLLLLTLCQTIFAKYDRNKKQWNEINLSTHPQHKMAQLENIIRFMIRTYRSRDLTDPKVQQFKPMFLGDYETPGQYVPGRLISKKGNAWDYQTKSNDGKPDAHLLISYEQRFKENDLKWFGSCVVESERRAKDPNNEHHVFDLGYIYKLDHGMYEVIQMRLDNVNVLNRPDLQSGPKQVSEHIIVDKKVGGFCNALGSFDSKILPCKQIFIENNCRDRDMPSGVQECT